MQEVGNGAFGKVFWGRRRGKPGSLRAIKMIRKQFNNSQATSEVLVLKTLDHPNLLKLYEIYTHQDYTYLVTE
jgi:calcium-dependent protein kinase